MRILKILLSAFFVCVFAIKIFTFFDPDLGWHIRAGQIVSSTNDVPRSDPWTYTMRGHEWIDHEWFVDLLFWELWSNDQWALVELSFLLLSLFPLLFWIAKVRYPIELPFVLLSAYMLFSVIGVRPQVISIFGFAIVAYLLRERLEKGSHERSFFLLPFIFWIWSNLHAGFAAGLFLFGIYLAYLLLMSLLKGDIRGFVRTHMNSCLTFIASLFATLCNPYGIDLWREILRGTATPLNSYIMEWQSSFTVWNVTFPLYAGLLIGLVLGFRRKLKGLSLLLVAIFSIFAALHSRMIPFLLIVAIPIIREIARDFDQLLKRTPDKKVVARYIDTAIGIGIMIMLVATAYSEGVRSPYTPDHDAAHTLHRILERTGGNVFNEYGLGGTLILDDPSSSVFVDGRLPHWKNNDGFSAFQEYLDTISKPDHWRSTFMRYGITTVIMGVEHDAPKDDIEKRESALSILPLFIQHFINTVFPVQKEALNDELRSSGWCEVYRNSQTFILVAPNTTLCMKNELK